jgi:uncharacterized protein (TIGR02145 family)
MRRITQSIAFMLVISLLIGSCKKETMNSDPIQPTVSTTAISSITTTTAVSGGNVTADGGAPVTAKGICWDVNPNPTTALTTKTNDGDNIGSFVSNLSGLSAGTTYYVRAYATNAEGTAYGNQVVFNTDGGDLPTLTTNSASSITAESALSGGVILTDGGLPITQRGICWSTSANPTIISGSVLNFGGGTGNFSGTMSGLQANTIYFVRAFATNAAGTGYGNSVSFTTSIGGPSYPPGTMHCMGTPTAVVDVINPATGKIWMDRNLGATQKATSSTDADSYGDLYQWGRRADLHQCRNSMTTSTLSSSDQPAHGSFIITNNAPFDWRSPQNTNLWQGVNGVNNPCPIGYRLPTQTELNSERTSWSTNSATGAFGSTLKLPMAGFRMSSGSLLSVGTNGVYWSSTVNTTFSHQLYFTSSDAFVGNSYDRARGLSVRCLKN